ncbi:MAG: hypothetical protein QOD30_861 [Actinomycetota bacterium]|nr:hypothetical protein [Actinomycetota bacterium]
MLLVCIALTACSGGAGGDDAVDDRGVEIGRRAEPYRIVYRLDDRSDPNVEPTTDEVWVRQPFESRLETSRGSTLESVQISAIDRLRLGTIDQPLVIARVPGLAVSDVRVAPVLDDAIDAGLLVRAGLRKVLDRRCELVRSGTLLGAGPLVPITDAEHAETCIDREGLVLEETLFSEGKPTLHRVATTVDTSPDLTNDQFAVGDLTAAVDKGAGSTRPVDPHAGALGSFWVLGSDAVPRGFDLVGRYSIVPPQSDRFAVPGNPAIVAGTADVYVRDSDFLVVWQGGTAGRVVAFPPTPGARQIDGGALGAGEAVLSALGNELHFPHVRGRFVHVVGTLTVRELTVIARDLRETQGTGLVYLDG